ncbi:hypothetical protein CEXT_476541 [Caerostris extrusa]|uniref:Uncharacterized protein n=1 Tax=Caerostris extrusa TaxID=172846 RepID=A0AAV4XDM2_CAEEX|nr:hypothetical protein CEXT_476541 [Caerostris extrusa]
MWMEWQHCLHRNCPAKIFSQNNGEESVAVAVTLSFFVISVWCCMVRLQQPALMHSLHRFSGGSKGVIICICIEGGGVAIEASETERGQRFCKGVRDGVLQCSPNSLGN